MPFGKYDRDPEKPAYAEVALQDKMPAEGGDNYDVNKKKDHLTAYSFLGSFCAGEFLGLEELTSISLYRGIFGEFLACMFFLFSAMVASNALNGNLISIAFAFGLAIVILVQIFADISGGHINSAVTVGLLFAGRCSVVRALLYIPAQIAGSILGVFLVKWTIPDGQTNWGLGLLAPASGVSDGMAVLMEFLFTSLLILQVLVCTDGKRTIGNNSNIALSIGLTVLFAHLVLVPIDGCGINPSRAIASAVVRNVWDKQWIYWVGPMLAALVAPPVYEVILRKSA